MKLSQFFLNINEIMNVRLRSVNYENLSPIPSYEEKGLYC